MFKKQRNVVAPLPQRRKSDLDCVQPKEQVLPEALFIGELLGRHIGCGNDPHVDRKGTVRPYRDYLALLECGKQLRLKMKRQIPNLVEEKRAVVCCLEPADAFAGCAREGTFDVSEQLRLRTPSPTSRRGPPRPLVRRISGTGGGFRGRRSPCQCRSHQE